jgi:hypothetical protein
MHVNRLQHASKTIGTCCTGQAAADGARRQASAELAERERAASSTAVELRALEARLAAERRELQSAKCAGRPRHHDAMCKASPVCGSPQGPCAFSRVSNDIWQRCNHMPG